MRFPIVARIAAILAIALALLIPLALIKGKVIERQERASGVLQGFAQETAGTQVLPDQREVSSAGFTASWTVNHFATGGNAFWSNLATEGKLFSSPRLLGVALVEPVNSYSLAYRATEYGFLFVLLTFSAFALVELTWKVTLHPAQYLLAGLALAVFFLVLIALSEHIHFAWAYLAASSACIALLTYYLRYPLASLARTTIFAGLFSALYGSLYLLLKSEDHALLLGSLLVFAALAAVMALTRKLDWAVVSKRLSPGTPASI